MYVLPIQNFKPSPLPPGMVLFSGSTPQAGTYNHNHLKYFVFVICRAAAVREDSGSATPTTAGVAPGSSSWVGDKKSLQMKQRQHKYLLNLTKKNKENDKIRIYV